MNVWGQVRVFSFCIWGDSNGQIGPIEKSWSNCGHYSFDDSNDFENGNDHSFDSFEKGDKSATFRQLYLFRQQESYKVLLWVNQAQYAILIKL